jgi:hypothetical protein
MGAKSMNKHFRVIASDDYNKALSVIEKQRALFVNTVEQFKRDLTYMQGLMTMMAIEHKKTNDVSEDAIIFVRNHIEEMQSMLNDFNVVLSREESGILYNNNEDMR